MTFITLVHEISITMFAGIALYINVVEHPARMTLPTEFAVSQWAPSYKKAASLQASLAIIAIVFGLIAFLFHYGTQYLISACLMIFVFGFTMVVIMPTNKKLLSLKTTEEKKQKEVKDLLQYWNILHGGRTLASLIAVILIHYYKLAMAK